MHPLVLAAALIVSPQSVNLNPAQQQIVSVTGAAAPLTVTLDNKLVSAVAASDGTNVTFTASQARGDDVAHVVDAAGASVDIPIRVAFDAGTIVAATTLQVTGDSVDPAWLVRRVTDVVARATAVAPGAQADISAPQPPDGPLLPGQSTVFDVGVQLRGNGEYFDRSGSTQVSVQNVGPQPFAPSLLFYDDDPEHVSQDGVLFRGTVEPGKPARLYYYHDAAGDPRRLVVAINSNSQDPTSVHVVEASAGPNEDVMHVGQTVTKNFLVTKAAGEGVVVNLSQDEPYLLADVLLTARQLVAGTVDLEVLSGGPAVVTVLTVSPNVDPRSLLAGPALPDDGHHRTGVFALSSFGSDQLTYAAGGPDATLVIGDTEPTPPNADPNATGHDYGDYGVLHRIDLTLTNTSASPVPAYLYFKPLAGPARAAFLIGNSLVDLGCVRLSTPYQVTSFQLAPGQTYREVVQTMTDGGSFYPAQIGVTATPPQPSAPPVTAPDGCFPKPAAAATR